MGAAVADSVGSADTGVPLARFGGADLFVGGPVGLVERDLAPLPVPVAGQDDPDPELIHPGWRGERFHLAESVGALCRAADDHTTHDRTITTHGDPEFDNVIRINDFSRHMS